MQTSWDAYLQLTAEATLESCSYEELLRCYDFILKTGEN